MQMNPNPIPMTITKPNLLLGYSNIPNLTTDPSNFPTEDQYPTMSIIDHRPIGPPNTM